MTDSGAVTWITAGQALPAGATSPTAEWYAERAREFAEMARDLECQINGIGCCPAASSRPSARDRELL